MYAGRNAMTNNCFLIVVQSPWNVIFVSWWLDSGVFFNASGSLSFMFCGYRYGVFSRAIFSFAYAGRSDRDAMRVTDISE